MQLVPKKSNYVHSNLRRKQFTNSATIADASNNDESSNTMANVVDASIEHNRRIVNESTQLNSSQR